jgi:2-polyprenyl-6-methoxyphenol hydroxylase-like FAD-dependent oxidoreductase
MEQQKPEERVEVLIVGAGPTGLMMACQLAIYQVSFRIIDKNESPSENSGALIVQARSLEIFEKMGIAGEALREGIIADKINVVYNGKKITSTGIKDIGEGISRFPFLLMLEQSKTEKLLVNFIEEHGFSVERRIRFKCFTETEEGITSVVMLPDNTEQSIKSNFLIAADGVNSTLRNLLNIPFRGKTYPKPLFILDCKAETDLAPGQIYFAFSNSSIAGFFPLQGARWRIDSNFPEEIKKSETITFEDIEKNFHLWTKMEVTFKGYEWFSVSHSQQRYAKRVRAGNCFLAGDAAHVNTPVGAQGMNTGIQDAFNLAWKLAFVIKQKAGPELLDTYSTERSGISKGFARYADIVFVMVTSKNIALNLCRSLLMKPILKFIFQWVAKRRTFREMFYKSISQTGLRYRESSLSSGASEGDFSRDIPGPGERLPYLSYNEKGKKVNIQDNVKGAGFHLIILNKQTSTDEMIKVAERYKDILSVENIPYTPGTENLYDRLGIENSGCYLIRPDMYIAYRSNSANTEHFVNYLQQYLM